MQHDSITDIDAHMGNAGSIVGPDKENEITGLRIRSGNRSADIVKSLRTEPSGIDESAVCEDIGHKAGAVEGCVWIRAAPYIGVVQILLSLFNESDEGFIRQICGVDRVIIRWIGDVLVHIL